MVEIWERKKRHNKSIRFARLAETYEERFGEASETVYNCWESGVAWLAPVRAGVPSG